MSCALLHLLEDDCQLQARQKDRSGIFAASDATPAESSHGEESAAHTDAEAAEEDENSGQEASDSMLEGAAGLSLPKVGSFLPS